MSENLFIPRMKKKTLPEIEEVVVNKSDVTGTVIHQVAQYAVIALLGLVSIFFTPGLFASLGFDKAILTIVTSAVVVIAISLLMVRRVETMTVIPVSLILFWSFILVSLASGLLSGDTQDAIRGSVMETQTAAFLGVMGLAMTIPLVLQNSKLMSIKALAFFGCTTIILLMYNILRLLLGAEFLQFSSFGAVTVSPVGGFNDLAIFSGLVIILGLITMAQLPLKAWLRYTFAALIVASLALLSIVNFFNIWLIVGFFALLMFLFLLSRDTLFQNAADSAPVTNSKTLIISTLLVCVVSALFIVAGEYAGGKIGEITNVDYVEVRPSVGATLDVARSVYGENILLGVGPNRFADAWRQYKDRSINETVFWDTDFNAGSGFIPTIFVSVGLLGGVLVVLFHLYFLYLGYRMLLRTVHYDSYWYYFGSVSFAAACFVWVMSYIYVPGAGILLLGAIFTGFTFVAASSLLPSIVRKIPLAVNRRRGFFLMAAVILIITSSIGGLLSVGKQYVAEAKFSKAQITAESIEQFELAALNSFELYPDDRFLGARAQIYLSNLTALLGIQDPSEEEQQRFLSTAEQALLFAEQAVAEDLSNPDNHAVLAGVYSNLAMVGIDGAQERSEASLGEAERLDPLNPGYKLLAAQMAARTGDISLAREKIAAALNLKRNFTQALFLSAQLDINEGKTESAIATTRAIITLEPNNPTRYFQLGILLSADNKHDGAISAYQAAITLDPAYANARYMLALEYLNSNQTEIALEQLRVVQAANAENEQLGALIKQVESGEYVATPNLGFTTPVNESSPNRESDDAVTTSGGVDTDLVTPVNTISDTGSKAANQESDTNTSSEGETESATAE